MLLVKSPSRTNTTFFISFLITNFTPMYTLADAELTYSLNHIQLIPETQGTAISTCINPTYANIFMGAIERRLLSSFPDKLLVWLRYIDGNSLVVIIEPN